MSALVPFESPGGLSLALTARCEIVSSTLADAEQNEIIQFYRDFPRLFRFQVERYYPLSTEQIERYSELWDWWGLQANPNLPWSAEFESKFEHKWKCQWLLLCGGSFPFTHDFIHRNHEHIDLRDLSHRSVLFNWTADLIAAYVNRWDWRRLSGNDQLPLNIELIQKFAEHWNWGELIMNPAMPWSMPLIEYLMSNEDSLLCVRACFAKSFPWTAELLDEHQDYWHWDMLSLCEHLPWSQQLIDRYLDRWDWNGIDSLSTNTGLPWSAPLLALYTDRWDWAGLSGNTALPWSMELVERYMDRWNWAGLSGNTALPWSMELIERYMDRWDWKILSSNRGIPFTEELLEAFRANWYWRRRPRTLSASRLSLTEMDIPWTDTLIERFKEQIKWSSLGSSSSKGVPWSVELIDNYKDRWDWRCLRNVDSLPWSREFYTRYADRFGIVHFPEKFGILRLTHHQIDDLLLNAWLHHLIDASAVSEGVLDQ